MIMAWSIFFVLVILEVLHSIEWNPKKTHMFDLFFLFVVSGTENLDELVSAVMQRTGGAKDNDRPQILVKISSYFSYILSILA